jgi:predicted alpha-1,2-mannosidase
VGFRSDVRQVTTKVGISLVSVEQARANIAEQAPGWDFDAMRAEAEDRWRERLSAVQAKGGTDRERRIFYSSIYRLGVLPTNQSEAGGWYMGFDRQAHQSDDFEFYSDLSLWDTFRTYHPLIELIQPGLNRDVIVSMQKIYEQGGGYPRWAQGIGETEVMIGTHADTVIADSYLKGNTDIDIETIYEGLREHAVGRTAPGGRSAIEDWLALGYVAEDHKDQSVSRTQEYALNDYCLAQLADTLGREADYDMFMERAYNYRNVWDDETGFFRPRLADGSWDPDFTTDVGLVPNSNGFTEGNARHWLWFVLHDIPDLIELFGGAEPFVSRLDEFLTLGMPLRTQLMAQPYYWHGNEPDMHAAYLFNYAGRPDLAQYWVRWIMENRYDDTPNGIDGNDDGGTLSAWYIFSALGFYPWPCTNTYAIGSPLFEHAIVKVGDHELEVIAHNVGQKNIYVRSVALNGQPLDKPWFDHADIAAGGTLEFEMAPTPQEWGR